MPFAAVDETIKSSSEKTIVKSSELHFPVLISKLRVSKTINTNQNVFTDPSTMSISR